METIRQETNMYFVFLFVCLAHTGQLMLRERQQKKPT